MGLNKKISKKKESSLLAKLCLQLEECKSTSFFALAIN
ncbi:hypothetical protein RV17_GL002446 [Enterococcus thailandicus]|nr:hypothetical protein RV17_GL002446 [Enterococcus thailandicus]